MGLLFQPRRAGPATQPPVEPRTDVGARDPEVVLLAALEAVVLGDASRFDQLFTEDVTVSSPRMTAASRAEVQAMLGYPESALTDIDISLMSTLKEGDRLVAEWRLRGTFSHPVLFEDDLLVEPTGGTVQLDGASFADFRSSRIRRFRHYFDDSELLTDGHHPSPELRLLGRTSRREP